jgi:DNA-binding transcriptional LysR family regulator
MDWDDLRFFLALARSGSIRGAGAELGVSHTTVARRVDGLEEKLGARLFDRHRDGFVLTEAGHRLVPTAVRVEDEVAAAARDLAGRDARLAGPVRVTCGDEVLAGLLFDALAEWCQAHPEVDLQLVVDGRPFNLAKGEADVAVRVLARGASPPEYLVGQRVAPLVVASYGAREPALSLACPRWLGFPDARALGELVRGSSYPDLPVWGSFSTLSLMVRAAARGLGWAMLPTYVGDAEPALVRLPTPDLRHVADLWLLHHPDLKANARVQAARSALKACFSRNQARFDGRCMDAPGRFIDGP